MNPPYRIALVNYLNAKPFLYGLEKYSGTKDLFDVHLFHPARCAEVFNEKNADIALVPVGALPKLRDYKIITPYGIAADNEVRTVCLFSMQEKENWKRVFLDSHSRTSVALSKLIIQDYWKMDVSFVPENIENLKLEDGDALLLIGDKVFDYENDFTIKYDLASVWKEWTESPFIFAVWVSSPDVPEAIADQLTSALRLGIEQIQEVIKTFGEKHPILQQYYQQYIRYELNTPYMKGMERFLSMLKNHEM